MISREFGSYVMENILFKVSFPAEFHAQTVAEAAMQLHSHVIDKLDSIQEITIHTQESAVRIIDKKGPLLNPADRDHCLQYIAAVAMLHGDLTSEHYEDIAAADPRIDTLRRKDGRRRGPHAIRRDYLDPELRSISNRIQVRYSDGTQTESFEVEFPLGHRRRRAESLKPLETKFRQNAGTRFSAARVDALFKMFEEKESLLTMRVSEFMDQFAETNNP